MAAFFRHISPKPAFLRRAAILAAWPLAALGLAFALAGVEYGGLRALHRLAAPLVGPAAPRFSNYVKNPHVELAHQEQDGAYLFNLRFKDPHGRDWRYQWSYDKQRTNQAIAAYGLTPELTGPFYTDPASIAQRRQALAAALFKANERLLEPDHGRVAAFYQPFTLPLYQMALQSAAADNGTGQPDQADPQALAAVVLALAQDIPYAVPDDKLAGRFNGGLLVPPQLFLEGFGDCDTKTVLMASILSHHPGMELAVASQPNHMFLAMAGTARPYQAWLEYRGRTYLPLEGAGPGRLPLGRMNEGRVVGLAPLAVAPYQGEAQPPELAGPSSASRDYSGNGIHLKHARFNQGLLTVELVNTGGYQLLPQLQSAQKDHLAAPSHRPTPDGFLVEAAIPGPGVYTLRIFSRAPDGPPNRYEWAFDYLLDTGRPQNL